MRRKNSDLIVIAIVFFLSCFVLFLFGRRFVYPDVSFDTVNYHFFLGKSGVENFPEMFKSSEFFPLGMHSFNPLLDMANYLVSKLIGYRLGTVLSLFSLLGSFFLTIRIFYKITQSKLALVATVFFIPALIVNEGMFQVATYFTDNHYAFFVLSYVYVLMGINKDGSSKSLAWQVLVLGFIIGVLATKLTNVIYIIPFVGASLYLFFDRVKFLSIKKVVFLVSVFCIPSLVVAGWYFWRTFYLTGNPVFPYYNGLFKSIYYSYDSWHFNYGPTTLFERIFYPFLTVYDPVRLGEVKDFFPDIKLLTTFFFAVIALILLFSSKVKLNVEEKLFAYMVFGCFLVWQMLFGYTRYAIALEFLLGLLVIVFINKLLVFSSRLHVFALIILYLFFSLWQSISILQFNAKYDIAWRPAPSFNEWKEQFFSKHVFKHVTDYDVALAEKLTQSDIIVQCITPSSVYPQTFVELEDKPMLNFDKGWNWLISSNENYVKQRDAQVLKSLGNIGVDELTFATIFNIGAEGKNSLKKCLDAIKVEEENGRSLRIHQKITVDNFVGDSNQQLMVLLGSYYLNTSK